MKRKLSALTVTLAILLAACMPSQEQIDELVKSAEETAIAQVTIVPAATQSVDQIVQATFQALTAQASIPTLAPTATPGAGNNPQTGSISGQLSYPSNFIPAMAVVAFDTMSFNYYYVVTNENTFAYQIDNVPPGSYYVVAYPLNNPTYPGGYTYAVPCGLLASCSDHSLIAFAVTGGSMTSGIDPGDFYAPAGTFPANPVP